MEVNDDAGYLNRPGALSFFASRLAPTRDLINTEVQCGRFSG